jgi:hypothetical protein
MRRGHGPRGVSSGHSLAQPWPLVVLSATLALALGGVYHAPGRLGSSAHEAPLARVAIDVDRPGALIPPDLDGLSMEYPAVGAYLGATPAYPNAVFRRLLSNLGQGSLRIGGDSQDTSCWNATGRRSRKGCLFNVGPSLPRVILLDPPSLCTSTLDGASRRGYNNAAQARKGRTGNGETQRTRGGEDRDAV